MKVFVIISAGGEWKSVKSFFPDSKFEGSPFGEFTGVTLDAWNLTLFHGGWGKVSAAASAQYVIDSFQPDLLVNLGTCGGFQGRIEQGVVILVERTIVYDIVEQMTGAEEAIEHYSTKLDLSWLPRLTPSPVSRGLLVSSERYILV